MNGVGAVDKLGPAPLTMAAFFCSSQKFYFRFTDFLKKAKEMTKKGGKVYVYKVVSSESKVLWH